MHSIYMYYLCSVSFFSNIFMHSVMAGKTVHGKYMYMYMYMYIHVHTCTYPITDSLELVCVWLCATYTASPATDCGSPAWTLSLSLATGRCTSLCQLT